jgi:hypothetical protein
LLAERLGVWLTCGVADLVTPDGLGDGVVRELDLVVVPEVGLALGDRRGPREPSMPDPAEDVPADRPVRWGDGDFELRALGLGVTGAAGIGAVVELADQLPRSVEGMEVPLPVIADVPHPRTGRAIAVKDVEIPEGAIGIRRPLVGHPADLMP